MRLAEFTASWIGNYTPEQERTYNVLYGDNREAWPQTNDLSPIVIDLERVCRFNPHHDEGKTTIEIAGGLSFSILIGFDEFKTIMLASSSIEYYKK